ncbi:riboflavin kinase [Priestia megaterium]
MKGQVVPGRQQGRHLGFPTANIDTQHEELKMACMVSSFICGDLNI